MLVEAFLQFHVLKQGDLLLLLIWLFYQPTRFLY